MTVEQLYQAMKDEIDNGNGDKDVVIASNSGDYWKTVVCDDIDSIDTRSIVYSEYHNKFKLPKDDEDLEDDDNERSDKIRDVIVLS